MSYLEVQKIHDLNSLQHDPGAAARDEVLRMVLAIMLDSDLAAWCLGCRAEAPVVRWPSTLYRLLARAALESTAIWRRCALLLDRSLETSMAPYAAHSPAELAEVFLEGRDSLSGDELAALLWCLLRQRSRSHDLIAERLGLELEVVAARRLHETRLPQGLS